MSIMSKPYFHDETAALIFLEDVLWPNGAVCPHCGEPKRIYHLNGVKDKKGRVRPGLRKCGACRKQFTVRVGTVFESSHVPLFKWLQATYLLCSSKKGISAHQLHRVLEVQYKTAWFVLMRLREAMRSGDLTPPFGSGGGIVEVDETFINDRRPIESKGAKNRHPHPRGTYDMMKVLSSSTATQADQSP